MVKSVPAFVVIALILVSCRPPQMATKDEVLTAVKQWEAALPWVQSDTAAIEQVLAPDYTEITDQGEFMDRGRFVAYYKSIVDDMKAGKFTQASQTSELRVRTYGITAVVTGRLDIRGEENKVPFVDCTRFTSVWVKRDGRFQEVNYQPSGGCK